MKQILVTRWIWAIVFLLNILHGSNSFKALFLFPFSSKSHVGVFIVLAEELARRGHDITVLSHFPQEKKNYREIIIDPKPFSKFFDGLGVNVTTFRHINIFFSELVFYKLKQTITEISVKDENFQDLLLSTEHYDVILGEIAFGQPYIAAIGHKFGAPVIDLHAAPTIAPLALRVGNPLCLAYYPNFKLPQTDRMTFWERLNNALISLLQIFEDNWLFIPSQDALVKKYFTYPGAENIPRLRDMIQNISLTLVNTHFSFGYPRSYAPNVIEVAGMHLKPFKKLPQDLEQFMDEAEHGVIYFSFGSYIKKTMLGEERIHSIAAALKRLPQRVIMKWDDPTPFQNTTNVLVLSWAPQQDILGHPKLLLFVTHGGYNSLIEATHAGVPILGIPIFADQFQNIILYEHRGIGKGLDIETFTADSMYESIVHIINTPSYKENAKEIARRTQDRPHSALETAVFWVEYVVRHKGAHHLKPASVYIPLYQLSLIDIIGALFLFIFIVYKLICKLCCSRFGLLTRKREADKKKTN